MRGFNGPVASAGGVAQRAGGAMAKSSVVVDGDISAVTRLCADAIKAAGGSVSSSVPGEPIRFTIKRPGSWRDSKNTP